MYVYCSYDLVSVSSVALSLILIVMVGLKVKGSTLMDAFSCGASLLFINVNRWDIKWRTILHMLYVLHDSLWCYKARCFGCLTVF